MRTSVARGVRIPLDLSYQANLKAAYKSMTFNQFVNYAIRLALRDHTGRKRRRGKE